MGRLAAAAVLLVVVVIPSSSQERKKREPDPLMIQKLKESQALLEGLALNDPAKVQASAEELLRISKAAQFRKRLSTGKYEFQANTFQRAAETAIQKAKEKNIDGATLAYVEMTMTCVRCHQHTREEGIGLLPSPAGGGIGR